LLTGLWPHHHGSREVGQHVRGGKTLATVLCEEGFATLAVSASTVAGPKQGLHRGFAGFVKAHDNAEGVNARTVRLLAEAPVAAPLFLWVHYIDPHFEYRPPRSWRDQPQAPGCRKLMRGIENGEMKGRVFADDDGAASRVLEECKALYDAEIAYTDAQVGVLLDQLRAAGWLDDALVVFSSDHGENLGEAGLYYEHGPSLHDASLRVPLVMSGPGIPAGVVDRGVARLEDVMPTLLSLLRVPRARWPAMDGVDLSARLSASGDGADQPRVALAESGGALHRTMFGYLWSGRASGRHCLNGPRYSLCSAPDEPARLYDRVADPALGTDVSDRYPEIVQRMVAGAAMWSPSRARERTARTPEFKLVESPQLEGGYRRVLYDLHADPGETADVSAAQPEVLRSLGSSLDRWAAELPAGQGAEPPPEEIEALRALGYVD
jgi:arylsulfatase A-like enzyme